MRNRKKTITTTRADDLRLAGNFTEGIIGNNLHTNPIPIGTSPGALPALFFFFFFRIIVFVRIVAVELLQGCTYKSLPEYAFLLSSFLDGLCSGVDFNILYEVNGRIDRWYLLGVPLEEGRVQMVDAHSPRPRRESACDAYELKKDYAIATSTISINVGVIQERFIFFPSRNLKRE